jgi:hypothetical protein
MYSSFIGEFDEKDQVQDIFESGIVVLENVAENWWEKTEICKLAFKVVFDHQSGKVFAIEMNGSPAHEQVRNTISAIISNWTNHTAVYPYFEHTPSSQNWGGLKKIADAGFDRRIGSPIIRQTVCLIEVGLSQSLNYLHQRRNSIFQSEHVQVYIFIKIYGIIEPPTNEMILPEGIPHRRIVATRYDRCDDGNPPNAPSQLWSFGTAPLRMQERNAIEQLLGFPANQILGNSGLDGSFGYPTGPGQLEIRLPSQAVWIGADCPPNLPDFVIDLYQVLIHLRDF